MLSFPVSQEIHVWGFQNLLPTFDWQRVWEQDKEKMRKIRNYRGKFIEVYQKIPVTKHKKSQYSLLYDIGW